MNKDVANLNFKKVSPFFSALPQHIFRRNRVFLRRLGILLGICGFFYGIFVWIPQMIYLHQKVSVISRYIQEGEWEPAKIIVNEVLSRQGMQKYLLDLHLQILMHEAESSDHFSHWMDVLQITSRYKSILYRVQYTSMMHYALTLFYLYMGETIDQHYNVAAIQNFEQLQSKGFGSISVEQQCKLLPKMVAVYIKRANYSNARALLDTLEKKQVNDIVVRHFSAVIFHAEGSHQEAMQSLQSLIFYQEDLTNLLPSVQLLVSLYEKLDQSEYLQMLVDHIRAVQGRSAVEDAWSKEFLQKYGGRQLKKGKKS